jgi:hypothetical protein
MTKVKSVSDTTKKEYARLLSETNLLRFYCNCGHKFSLAQPEGKWVRYNNETNFFIPMNDEHGKHTPIHCTRCSKSNGIHRSVTPWKAYFERKTEKTQITPPTTEDLY